MTRSPQRWRPRQVGYRQPRAERLAEYIVVRWASKVVAGRPVAPSLRVSPTVTAAPFSNAVPSLGTARAICAVSSEAADSGQFGSVGAVMPIGVAAAFSGDVQERR